MQISMSSQEARIADWLLSGHTITQEQAIQKWRCFRLAPRIYELRKAIKIETQMVGVGRKRWAQYRVAK